MVHRKKRNKTLYWN